MYLIQISIETRIIIGIAAMVLLFASFIIAFVTSQRKKLEYQKNLQSMMEQKQQLLAEQNQLLEQKVIERTHELNDQKDALQVSLSDLRNTQQQLIQSEKMASLGEMTSGIAHEIQNPLNFINNFSEVSVELFDEMEQVFNEGNRKEAEAIASEIKENLKKIHQHGKRADNIVKSMLEHTKTGTGKKELINLNEIAEESLRLSFHGQKAKNKLTYANFKFNPANDLTPIPVVAQEINRVLINICNNAFYAVWQKQQSSNDPAYEPLVTLSLHREGNMAVINAEDNGVGIRPQILSKIFQPFFTTKPTGEGTGLGLSISYDIVTKAHNGKMEVTSKEGEGTIISIKLPIE